MQQLNLYLEKFYDVDEWIRGRFLNDFYVLHPTNEIPSGSSMEGAFLTSLMIPVENKHSDIDVITLHGHISKDIANNILDTNSFFFDFLKASISWVCLLILQK